MIDAAQIIIITITVGARALVADNIIQVKAHTCGNAADDDNYSTCIIFKSRASKPHPDATTWTLYFVKTFFRRNDFVVGIIKNVSGNVLVAEQIILSGGPIPVHYNILYY